MMLATTLKATNGQRHGNSSIAMHNAHRFTGEDLRRIDYLPTPEEIAQACASIRSEWTLSEKRRRFVGEYMPDETEIVWRPPVIDTSHFRIGASQAPDGTP